MRSACGSSPGSPQTVGDLGHAQVSLGYFCLHLHPSVVRLEPPTCRACRFGRGGRCRYNSMTSPMQSASSAGSSVVPAGRGSASTTGQISPSSCSPRSGSCRSATSPGSGHSPITPPPGSPSAASIGSGNGSAAPSGNSLDRTYSRPPVHVLSLDSGEHPLGESLAAGTGDLADDRAPACGGLLAARSRQRTRDIERLGLGAARRAAR